MVGMAMRAGQIGILVTDASMQGSNFAHLCADLDMADNTMVSHGVGFPWRGVTGLAIALDRGMGGYAPNGLTRLGVEWTRVVEHTAAREGRPRNEEDGQQCGNDSHWGQAT